MRYEVIPGSITSTGLTLRTYVYQVWDLLGRQLGYFPCLPQNATFAYSILGKELQGVLLQNEMLNAKLLSRYEAMKNYLSDFLT